MSDSTPPPGTKRKNPRWGLRTVGFLLLGMVAIFTANGLGGHSIGTAACTVIAIIGATYCSIRGWRAMERLEWRK